MQESVAEVLIEKLKERMKQLRVGTSLDKCVDMGAIVDDSQRKSIEEYVESARKDGANVSFFISCYNNLFYAKYILKIFVLSSQI